VAIYPQRLALTSPTSGSRSVGTVRSQTQATEFTFSLYNNYFLKLGRSTCGIETCASEREREREACVCVCVCECKLCNTIYVSSSTAVRYHVLDHSGAVSTGSDVLTLEWRRRTVKIQRCGASLSLCKVWAVTLNPKHGDGSG
jgi:hypothetical protein